MGSNLKRTLKNLNQKNNKNKLTVDDDFSPSKKPRLKTVGQKCQKFFSTNFVSGIDFCRNGLVRNYKYYDISEEYGNYVVAKFQQQFSSEIRIDDFRTLYENQWLTDFAINYSLTAIKKIYGNKSYVLLTTNQTYAVMHCGNALEETFFLEFPEIDHNSIIVFPIIIGTILNRDHWVLAVANMADTTFLYIDPRHNNIPKEASVYKEKFEIFFAKYLSLKKITTGKPNHFISKNIAHIKQRDGYNCGVYVVYFIMQIMKNDSLLKPESMDEFRKKLVDMILELADDNQTKYCLVCGYEVVEIPNENKCETCNRVFHTSCWTIRNHTCSLCTTFLKL